MIPATTNANPMRSPIPASSPKINQESITPAGGLTKEKKVIVDGRYLFINQALEMNPNPAITKP
jgi:hypothetical protein